MGCVGCGYRMITCWNICSREATVNNSQGSEHTPLCLAMDKQLSYLQIHVLWSHPQKQEVENHLALSHIAIDVVFRAFSTSRCAIAHFMAVRSLSLPSGIAGVPCQFSVRGSGFRSSRKNVAVQRKAGLLRIRAQEEGQEESATGSGDEDDFDARLAKLQRKVTSGSGKKAEARKARKDGLEPMMTSSSSSTTKDLFIPPVPLKDPVADGLVVELGMKPYTERLNGRVAALGLAAVLLVELATGDSFLHYHDSGTLFVQVYTVVGLAGLYAKYEKERISVWPKD